MTRQTQERKPAARPTESHLDSVEAAELRERDAQAYGRAAVDGQRIKEELDDLMDEIDSVLETNAEEFVRTFVQKGGE